MTPYFEDDEATIYNGKAEDVMPTLDAASVDLIIADLPYFRVKGDWWDRQWDNEAGFLAWVRLLADQWQRILAPNGSLYVYASPDRAWAVEGVIRERFNVLNSVRWVKEEGWHNKAEEEALRSYLSNWEAVIFAEQRGADKYASGEAGYEDAARLLHQQVYAPIGRYIQDKRTAAGLSRQEVDTACAPSRKPTGLCYRWEDGDCLPTPEQFKGFMRLCGDTSPDEALRQQYEALRQQYEALRQQYEALRRPFNVTNRTPKTDTWNYKTVTPYAGKHPCEKPLAMLQDMIRASSKPGAVVLDCCMGSGSTLKAAKYVGNRRAIGIEVEAHWCLKAKLELSQGMLFESIAV